MNYEGFMIGGPMNSKRIASTSRRLEFPMFDDADGRDAYVFEGPQECGFWRWEGLPLEQAMGAMINAFLGVVHGAEIVRVDRGRLQYLRRMKDENGQYLWSPSIVRGEPDKFIGIPVEVISEPASPPK